MDEELFISTDLARRLKTHPNTIRLWADRYKRHMSPGAVSGARQFTAADFRVLATVMHYRAVGMGLDKIGDLLDAGNRVDELPPPPDPREESARAAVELIPRERLHRALDELQRLTEERDRVLSERDTALQQVASLNERIEYLQREVGTLSGKLAIVETERKPAAWWLRLLAAAVVIALALGAVLAVLALLAAR